MPPGTYGDWAVEPSGRIVVAGTPYLAGSNQSLEVGLRNLMAAISWTVGDALASVTCNPAVLLGHPVPRLDPGEPANLVLFQLDEPGGFMLKRTCVDGVWHEPP